MLLIVIGCTSGGDSDASASATAAASPSVEATVTPTPPAPSPTAPPPTASPTIAPTSTPLPPRTVWLIDAAGGETATLHQDQSPAAARFDPTGTRVELSTNDGPLAFALDGSSLLPEPARSCTQDGEAAVLDGVAYEEVRCAPLSPGGRWMLFQVPISDATSDWDQWVLDLEAGERRLLQSGLRHCGGCDGRLGPAFSLTGAHVYLSELIQNGRIYASNLVSGETELIADGRTEIDRRPLWAPDGVRLLYSDDGARVLLRDFTTGEPTEVPGLTWPATFDATGAAIYSPAYASEDDAVSTRVVHATTFETLANVPGAPDTLALWFPRAAVALSAEGPVTAVEHAPSCTSGTTICAPAVPGGRCFEGAVGAAVAPDGRHVVLAVVTEPAASHGSLAEYQLLLIDTTTLEVSATIEGTRSFDAPPRLEWNATGTHLLVTWPSALGL